MGQQAQSLYYYYYDDDDDEYNIDTEVYYHHLMWINQNKQQNWINGKHRERDWTQGTLKLLAFQFILCIVIWWTHMHMDFGGITFKLFDFYIVFDTLSSFWWWTDM
jgi:hypothetical protein